MHNLMLQPRMNAGRCSVSNNLASIQVERPLKNVQGSGVVRPDSSAYRRSIARKKAFTKNSRPTFFGPQNSNFLNRFNLCEGQVVFCKHFFIGGDPRLDPHAADVFLVVVGGYAAFVYPGRKDCETLAKYCLLTF